MPSDPGSAERTEVVHGWGQVWNDTSDFLTTRAGPVITIGEVLAVE
ncbi:MAG: hypothetical protein R3E01_05420 [Pirellulaceae bacterium]